MVGEGADADAATARFCAYWEDTAALAGSVLVYNTGRSLGQFTALWAEKAGRARAARRAHHRCGHQGAHGRSRLHTQFIPAGLLTSPGLAERSTR